jgi:hypothetical protein
MTTQLVKPLANAIHNLHLGNKDFLSFIQDFRAQVYPLFLGFSL